VITAVFAAASAGGRGAGLVRVAATPALRRTGARALRAARARAAAV